MGGVWGYCGYIGCGRKSHSTDPNVNACELHDRGDGRCADADAERRASNAAFAERVLPRKFCVCHPDATMACVECAARGYTTPNPERSA